MNTELAGYLDHSDRSSDGIDISAEPLMQLSTHLAPSRELWVALMFTDLEGSTALWHLDAPAMERALAEHDFILHHLVEDEGGVVFKMAGDAVLTAFPSVASAARCAMKATSLMQKRDPFHPGCRLGARLRLVVHAGKVFVRDHDCFGPEVCYAARLVAAAPPREILMSEAALVALDRAELPSLQFEAFRTGPLRDFERERPTYRLFREMGPVPNVVPLPMAADD